MKYKACLVLIFCGVWLFCYVSPGDTFHQGDSNENSY